MTVRDSRLVDIQERVNAGEHLDPDDAAYLLDVIYAQQEQLFSQEHERDVEGSDEGEDGFDEFGECLRCHGHGCTYCE